MNNLVLTLTDKLNFDLKSKFNLNIYENPIQSYPKSSQIFIYINQWKWVDYNIYSEKKFTIEKFYFYFIEYVCKIIIDNKLDMNKFFIIFRDQSRDTYFEYEVNRKSIQELIELHSDKNVPF